MRVLIIEDEYAICAAIKKGLVQEGFAVDTATDGEKGFDMASSEEYDVIVLDLMLPKKDGLSICKELREAKVETPILILTARGMVEDKVKGLNSGADDYLAKPFAFEELLARVRALSRRAKKMVGTELKINDLVLNPSTFVVTKSGEEVRLSKKEFSLLEYLMRNTDKILTKDQIIEHVWDYDADILPNTVEVFIRNLRLKIDKESRAGKGMIQTIRGFGYRIVSKNV